MHLAESLFRNLIETRVRGGVQEVAKDAAGESAKQVVRDGFYEKDLILQMTNTC
jgi:hypothetical protein